MKFGWHCHCEAEYQHIEAEFGQDFEPGVWLSFWWWVSRFWDWNLVGILMLTFYRDFELKSSCVWSFWSWCLVEIWELNLAKILIMIFDQPMEWLKSYFGESTLLFVPLCFWQCFSLIFLFYILWCIAELALVTVPVGVSRAQPLSSIKPRLTHPDTHLCNDSPPKTLSKQKKILPEMEKAPPHKLQKLIHCLHCFNCLQSCIYADKYCGFCSNRLLPYFCMSVS